MKGIFKKIITFVLMVSVLMTPASASASHIGQPPVGIRWVEYDRETNTGRIVDELTHETKEVTAKECEKELAQYGLYHGPFLFQFPVDYGNDLYLRKGESLKLETSYDKNNISRFYDDTGCAVKFGGGYKEIIKAGWMTKIDAGLKYTTSDDKVAKVSQNGKIKATGYGDAVITVSVNNPDIISKVGEGMRHHLTMTVNVHVRKKKSRIKGMKYCAAETKDYIKVDKIGNAPNCDFNENFLYYYDKLQYDGFTKKEWVANVRRYKKYITGLYGKWLDGIITAKQADRLIRAARFYAHYSSHPDALWECAGGKTQASIVKRLKIKKYDIKKGDGHKLSDRVWRLGDRKLIQGKGFKKNNIYYSKKDRCYYMYLMESATAPTSWRFFEKFFGYVYYYKDASSTPEDQEYVDSQLYEETKINIWIPDGLGHAGEPILDGYPEGCYVY